MNSFSLSSADILPLVIHKISATILILGLLFLIIWVVKNVHKDKLKKLSITLIILGVLGALLSSIALGGGGYRSHKKFGYGFKDTSHAGIYTCLKDSTCKDELDALLLEGEI